LKRFLFPRQFLLQELFSPLNLFFERNPGRACQESRTQVRNGWSFPLIVPLFELQPHSPSAALPFAVVSKVLRSGPPLAHRMRARIIPARANFSASSKPAAAKSRPQSGSPPLQFQFVVPMHRPLPPAGKQHQIRRPSAPISSAPCILLGVCALSFLFISFSGLPLCRPAIRNPYPLLLYFIP